MNTPNQWPLKEVKQYFKYNWVLVFEFMTYEDVTNGYPKGMSIARAFKYDFYRANEKMYIKDSMSSHFLLTCYCCHSSEEIYKISVFLHFRQILSYAHAQLPSCTLQMLTSGFFRQTNKSALIFHTNFM